MNIVRYLAPEGLFALAPLLAPGRFDERPAPARLAAGERPGDYQSNSTVVV